MARKIEIERKEIRSNYTPTFVTSAVGAAMEKVRSEMREEADKTKTKNTYPLATHVGNKPTLFQSPSSGNWYDLEISRFHQKIMLEQARDNYIPRYIIKRRYLT